MFHFCTGLQIFKTTLALSMVYSISLVLFPVVPIRPWFRADWRSVSTREAAPYYPLNYKLDVIERGSDGKFDNKRETSAKRAFA
jgi:hypothetical protein